MGRKLIIDEQALEKVAFLVACGHYLTVVPEQPYKLLKELLYAPPEEGAEFYEHLRLVSRQMGEEVRAWHIVEETDAENAIESMKKLERSIIPAMKQVADNPD